MSDKHRTIAEELADRNPSTKTKELARRKWEEIKRQKALTPDELLNEIVITDSPPDEI